MPRLRLLEQARDRFRALLEQPDVPEVELQRLFADCPYILSEALPLRLHPEDVLPRGRPGRPEADFVFYPHSSDPPYPYGVVEIKRPDTRILRIPRKEVLRLSSDAATAFAQAKKYAMEMQAELVERCDKVLIVGGELHVFLIVGMSGEIAAKVTTQLLREQYDTLFPLGCRLMPFDSLLQRFESQIPPRIHILHTSLPLSLASLNNLVYELELKVAFHWALYDDGTAVNSWIEIEDEFLRIAGPEAHDERIVSKATLNSDFQRRLSSGQKVENPLNVQVCTFVSRAVRIARKYGIKSSLPDDFDLLMQKAGAYRPDWKSRARY